MDSLYFSIANFVESTFGSIEPMKYYAMYWRNYKNTGRASKAEFWWVFLINFCIGLLFSAIEGVVANINTTLGGVVGLIYFAWTLLCIYPSITLWIRRLHDVNKSGWFVLLGFCCFIVPFIFCIMDPVDPNSYGPRGNSQGVNNNDNNYDPQPQNQQMNNYNDQVHIDNDNNDDNDPMIEVKD